MMEIIFFMVLNLVVFGICFYLTHESYKDIESDEEDDDGDIF
jgi:hypothetical protein